MAQAGGAGSGGTIGTLFDGGTGLAMGRAARWWLWVRIAVASPMLEAIAMAIGLVLLRLALPPWPAAVASAIAWGLSHTFQDELPMKCQFYEWCPPVERCRCCRLHVRTQRLFHGARA